MHHGGTGMRSALFAAVAFTALVANVFVSERSRAAPLGVASIERSASQVEPAQYPYYLDDRYYDAPYPRRVYPPSIYYAPPRYYERRAFPYYSPYSPRAYDYTAPAFADEPPRPTSCGQYRYWNGEYCADARYERPYLGPKW
jgi:hypothetical protein